MDFLSTYFENIPIYYYIICFMLKNTAFFEKVFFYQTGHMFTPQIIYRFKRSKLVGVKKKMNIICKFTAF